MKTPEICNRFLEYFIKQNHIEVPSASLVVDDPNLLFVNAGMVPFVPYFLGQQTPPFKRATSIQKCVRTIDIDEVGKTARHNTFFQMAGNFSFGDYFKKEVIQFAWELLTAAPNAGGFGLDPERLWVTVYLDDEEAFKIWNKDIGIAANKIQKRGKEDNYWSMNIPGPCGPSSEIYFDKGERYGQPGGPIADEHRYLEVWNLVFMEKIRGKGLGKTDFEILGSLPQKNIDTGLGIERLASILQEVDNVYETDLLIPLMDNIFQITGKRYGVKTIDDIRFRIIADHSRTAVMLIGDGIVPSNEGRGYVLRRLLRRTIRSTRLLGYTKPALENFFSNVIFTMGKIYPQLLADKDRIIEIANAEEAAFFRTITVGTKIFDAAVKTARDNNDNISGKTAFELHDTYGFPLDLTVEMAKEAQLTVDLENFNKYMLEQRNKAKADAQTNKRVHQDISIYKQFLNNSPTIFTGYDELITSSLILGIFVDSKSIDTISMNSENTSEVEIILDRTPFYAESGGQLSDLGLLKGDNVTAKVIRVQKIAKRLWLHKIQILNGKLTVGDTVSAEIDVQYRKGAQQAHSATHLVHGALRDYFGPTAVQAGSLNRPGYLRFDFQYSNKITDIGKDKIEEIVNNAILANYQVNTTVTDLSKAKRMGALALFGEKYEDMVRVVEMGGPFSIELCGGTHVKTTAEIGSVVLYNFASVGSGIKRVEALVGYDANKRIATERILLNQAAKLLNVTTDKVPESITNLLIKINEIEQTNKKLQTQKLKILAQEIINTSVVENGIKIITYQLNTEITKDQLKELVNQISNILYGGDFICLLLVESGTKFNFIISVANNLVKQGISAKELLIEFNNITGGKGGGNSNLAQGVVNNPNISTEILIPALITFRNKIISDVKEKEAL